MLPSLERTIAAARERSGRTGSYTAALLADPARIGEKVMEEAEEVARAAREESDERVAEEAADVLYHLCVLLASRGLSLADAERVLDGRRRRLGRRRSGCPPAIDEVRELAARLRPRARCARRGSRIARRPVSAFLKLREDGPCFLLESADQGRVGRYSFIGYRPRKVLRWSLGDAGDPYAVAAAELGRSARRRRRRAAAVRGRRGGDVRVRPRPRGRARRRAPGGPARACPISR